MPHEENLTDALVLLLGAAGMDVVGRLDTELQAGTSNPAYIRSSFGGVARNVAENLARLGQPAALLSAVGEDAVGQQLVHHLAALGVDTHAVLHCPHHSTGAYLAVLDDHGALRFALDDMHIMQEITPAYLKQHLALFQQAEMLFLDTNLSPRTLRTAFSLARKAGLRVVADPTSTGLAARLKPYLDRLYCVVPNAREAAVLTDISFDEADRQGALRAARRLVASGVQVAVITLAEFGLCYATSDSSGHIPAIRTAVVDPTGAGDAFTAALMTALLADMPLDEAMRLGVSAASLTLQHRGAVNPDISFDKLYEHLVI
ncbi:MAG: ribokinase [Anaerolineae bacterium]|nr:MAG: ribokinase [Anaerolineae bacterium]